MKKFYKSLVTFILNLQFIFKPAYWIMMYSYDKEVDKIVNDLLDNYEFTSIDSTLTAARINDKELWIANRPYASMIIYSNEYFYGRPSRLTVQKGLRKFDKFYKNLKKLNNEW